MITWTLTEAEADLVGRALFERPYAEVAGLVQKLQSQVSAQQRAEQSPQTGGAPEGDNVAPINP